MAEGGIRPSSIHQIIDACSSLRRVQRIMMGVRALPGLPGNRSCILHLLPSLPPARPLRSMRICPRPPHLVCCADVDFLHPSGVGDRGIFYHYAKLESPCKTDRHDWYRHDRPSGEYSKWRTIVILSFFILVCVCVCRPFIPVEQFRVVCQP